MATRVAHTALLSALPLVIVAVTAYAREPEAPNHVAYAFPEPVDPALFADEPEPEAEPKPEPRRRRAQPAPELWPHWLESEYPLAEAFVPAHSSNFARGGMQSYDYIVVHTMEGYYAAAHNWFRNPIADVSAHFCMNAEGTITQMVSLSDRAWHVGNVNPYAIGIEHEGFVDGPSWYTWETYQSSALLARWLSDELDIPRDRAHIVGHSELRYQTHHDPGEGWDWELYMALIHDVVPRGRVEGWVVDRGRGCTITATRDAFVKQTLEPADALDPGEACLVGAGQTLTYLHASGELDGHLRLDYDEDAGPCPGVVGLETQGYVALDAFTPACVDTTMAVAGARVVLDDGARVVTDVDGHFEFVDVEAGAHGLDVRGGLDYLDALALVDLDVYPGRRVVIALDRIVDPDAPLDEDEDEGDGVRDDEDRCEPGRLDCPCDDSGACEDGLICAADLLYCVPAGEDPVPEGEDGALDPVDEHAGGSEDRGSEDTGDAGIGEYAGAGCSSAAPGGGGRLGLGLLALLGLARRRLWPKSDRAS